MLITAIIAQKDASLRVCVAAGAGAGAFSLVGAEPLPASLLRSDMRIRSVDGWTPSTVECSCDCNCSDDCAEGGGKRTF